MITVVNRDYCKKLIFVLPGQTHPAMWHEKKDETFFLVYGDLGLKLNGQDVSIRTGETVAIAPSVLHEFTSTGGAIIEEVSTNHSSSDSLYEDKSITLNKQRKTFVQYWL